MQAPFDEHRGAVGVALVVILFVKLAFVWAVVGPAQSAGLVPSGGANRDLYLDIARSVAGGSGYRVTPDTAETMVRNPGYVMVIAGLIKVFGDSLVSVRNANIAFAMGTVLIVLVLVRRFVTTASGVIVAMVIAGLYPLEMVMESRVNVESMFTFLLLALVWLLYRALQSGKLRDFALAGLALGGATLTRSTPMFMLPVFAVYLLLPLRALSWSRRLQQAGVLALMAVVVVAPWMLRNYQLSGIATFSESHVGIGAYEGWYATTTMNEPKAYQLRIEDARQRQPEIAAAAGAKSRPVQPPSDVRWDIYPTIQDELHYSDALLTEVLRQVRADPPLLFKHLAVNVVRFWFQGASGPITLLIVLIQGPLLAAAVAGAVLGFRRGQRLVPLLVPVAVTWGLHVPLIAHARYAVPLVPILAILASILWDQWIRAPSTATVPAWTGNHAG